jgi:hypothetical protein
MYGTIARMKGGSNALELFKQQESDRRPDGIIGTYIFESDQPDEFWAVVVFENKETYLANAQSFEQDREYRELRSRLRADPEWHDGEIVFSSFFPVRQGIRHPGDE